MAPDIAETDPARTSPALRRVALRTLLALLLGAIAVFGAIALIRNGLVPLVDALFDYLVESGLPSDSIRSALLADYVTSGARGNPQALTGRLPKREMPVRREKARALRQDQHLAGRLAEPVGLTDSAEV